MPRSSRIGALLAGIALLASSCGDVAPPAITMYADGASASVAPWLYCTALLERCEEDQDAQATMAIRPGMPVQISVPSEVAGAPWSVTVQTAGPNGAVNPPTQEIFTSGKTLTYTAQTEHPDDRVLLVEVQQASAAHLADETGEPVLDERGQPQLVSRGVWVVEFTEAE